MTEYMDYNTWLEKEVNNLKQTLKETREFFVDKCKENEQLKKRISNLVSENTKLQNDLFSEQLIQDETEEYINKLKKQNEKLYKPHEVFKFKEQIERLRIEKYKYIELYKQKYDENYKLSNELSLKNKTKFNIITRN